MLGNVLKTIRLEKGLTQKQVSNNLNISEARYNQYETNKRTPDHEILKDIANFYNVSIDYLLNNNDIPKNEQEIFEKQALKNMLVKCGYMKENEYLTKNELERLMEFIKTNKKYIKEEK